MMFDKYRITGRKPEYAEKVWVRDSYEECDYFWGGNDFILTDEDFELLKSGKILNFSVNGEYGCTLAYKKEDGIRYTASDNLLRNDKCLPPIPEEDKEG